MWLTSAIRTARYATPLIAPIRMPSLRPIADAVAMTRMKRADAGRNAPSPTSQLAIPTKAIARTSRTDGQAERHRG